MFKKASPLSSTLKFGALVIWCSSVSCGLYGCFIYTHRPSYVYEHRIKPLEDQALRICKDWTNTECKTAEDVWQMCKIYEKVRHKTSRVNHSADYTINKAYEENSKFNYMTLIADKNTLTNYYVETAEFWDNLPYSIREQYLQVDDPIGLQHTDTLMKIHYALNRMHHKPSSIYILNIRKLHIKNHEELADSYRQFHKEFDRLSHHMT
jgi:hypothetical protein